MRFIRRFNQLSFFKNDEFLFLPQQKMRNTFAIKDEILDNIEGMVFDYNGDRKILLDENIENVTETRDNFIVREKTNGVYTILYKNHVIAYTIKFFENKVVIVNNNDDNKKLLNK